MTTLLYVEDDDSNAFMLTRRMLRHGVQVTHLDSGEKALAAAAEHPPTLMLLDLHLPGLDGLAVLRRLRAEPATRALPVIVVSASVQDEARSAALAAGADAFMPKPIDFAQLLVLLSRWAIVESSQDGCQ